MSPKLIPLILPQLVEERRKRESCLVDSTAALDLSSSSSCFFTHNSSASDISAPPPPLTPTFSHHHSGFRGHLRYSSSTSSLDLPMHSSVADSGSSSPTFTGCKRSLPDLQEDPHEQEDHFDLFDDDDDDDDDDDGAYDCCGGVHHQCLLHEYDILAQAAFEDPTFQDVEYASTYSFFGDYEDAIPRSSKRRRHGEPLLFTNGIASRIGTSFPSFSRRWRHRKTSNPSALISPSQQDLSRSRTNSRAASSRSSSLTGSFRYNGEPDLFHSRLPPTPAASVFDEGTVMMPIDVAKAETEEEEEEEEDNDDDDDDDDEEAEEEEQAEDEEEKEDAAVTTPLLPPLMMEANLYAEPVYQSPLQSPSIAELKDPLAGNSTPSSLDPRNAAAPGAVPSPPPLSTKPSISSFHRQTLARPGHLVPVSEIPPIHIADANDEWANKLGHANFTVHPEPYLPATLDLQACRQLRTDWDLARCNYTKHLVRTGEHYGLTSTTFRLTEEKWAQVDAQWRKYNDETIARTAETGGDAFCTLQHPSYLVDASKVVTKIPSLNDPRSGGGGKFPQLGDEDIVGPMVQVAAQLPPNKKGKLYKFLADKIHAGLGRSLTS